MSAEGEFGQLVKRYLHVLEYEKTKYMNDTSEGKEWAEKEIIKIINQMSKLWDDMTEEERLKYAYIFK